jgi:hypothetical protein
MTVNTDPRQAIPGKIHGEEGEGGEPPERSECGSKYPQDEGTFNNIVVENNNKNHIKDVGKEQHPPVETDQI